MFSSQGWASDIDYGDESVDSYLDEARKDLELESGAWSLSGPSSAEVRDRAVFLASRGGCDTYAEYAEAKRDLTFEGAWGLVTVSTHSEVMSHLRNKQVETLDVAPVESQAKQTLFHEEKTVKITEDVVTLKKSVIAKLSDYDSGWKLKLFGHHHGKEVKLLKDKIARAESATAIEELLNAEKLQVKKGGYLNAIVAALSIIDGRFGCKPSL